MDHATQEKHVCTSLCITPRPLFHYPSLYLFSVSQQGERAERNVINWIRRQVIKFVIAWRNFRASRCLAVVQRDGDGDARETDLLDRGVCCVVCYVTNDAMDILVAVQRERG